ncbi:MAG: RNA-binding cell elongation regulator Jag/EloR [Anaerolineales bacterium]|nr:RNA-binding cell elongation regulator Jag/EloR [Anaerolineales bacterium]
MNERTTLEIIAPTVEEALAQGLADLGLTSEAVDVEVLDEGSRGLFGLGSRQVRVRLTIKAGASEPAAGQPAPAPEPEPIPRSGWEPAGARRPATSIETDELLSISEKTVRELLEKMKIEAQLSTRYGEPDEEGQRPVCVNIHGDDLSILIGRRAEILNALQYIVNLIVSKQLAHWVQIVVDVEGYRTRREVQLRKMARQMADQAVKTGRRQVLEPMSAGDRRILHLELRDHPEVTTRSIGEDPLRKVTIVPK